MRKKRGQFLLDGLVVASLLAGCAGAPSAPDGGPRLPREQAQADLLHGWERIYHVAPAIGWHTQAYKVDVRVREEVNSVPTVPNQMDVYLAMSRIVGMMSDAHVSVARPKVGGRDMLDTYLQSGGRLLGVAALPGKEGVLVLGAENPSVREGDTIRTINGRDAVALFAAAEGLQAGEPRFKRFVTALTFSERLWDLGLRAPFVLDGAFPGRPGHLETPGAPRRVASESPRRPNLSYQLLDDRIGLLRVTGLEEPMSVFRPRAVAAFEAISREKPVGLIVDIRFNFGGNSDVAAELLGYITGKPYRLASTAVVRASAECRDSDKQRVGSMAARLRATVSEGRNAGGTIAILPPPPNPLRYDGPVAVLIGPGTFSAANMLANAVGDFHLATLIGSDTGESASGSGETCPIVLPHTGITVSAPSAVFARANGDLTTTDDVHPDVVVANDLTGVSPDDLDLTAARRFIAAHLVAR